MTDFSPKAKSLNKSVALDRAISLNEMSSNGSDSDEDEKQLKLPEIILAKLRTTKEAMPFNNIPGLKTTKAKDLTKRAVTEKKQPKRDFSVDCSTKRNILHKPINKNTKGRINTKVMETWIEDTLEDAEHFDIPGVIIKPKQK